VELDDGTHGDGGGQKMDQMLNLEKKKEKNKNPMEIKAKVLIGILFLPIKMQ